MKLFFCVLESSSDTPYEHLPSGFTNVPASGIPASCDNINLPGATSNDFIARIRPLSSPVVLPRNYIRDQIVLFCTNIRVSRHNPRVAIPEPLLRTQNLLSRRQLLNMGITIRQGNIGDIVSPPFVSALNDVLCVAQVVV